jgi:hypothetical protein
MTDDCKRKGTTTLLAAFSVLGETVIGPCMQPHRHLEFIRFLSRTSRNQTGDSEHAPPSAVRAIFG